MKPLALITGVGPGTGSSIARRFSAAGYHTALVARDESRLNALAADDFFIRQDAIADEVFHLVQQDRSAWSFYAEVRSFHEVW